MPEVNAWSQKGNLKGPAGPQGNQGLQGEPGRSVRSLRVAAIPDGDMSTSDIQPAQGLQVDDLLIDPAGLMVRVTSLSSTVAHVGPALAHLQGPAGAKGDTGQDGTSVTILGSKSSSADLPSTGNHTGDGWLAAGDLYVWHGSGWTNVGRIQGPKGDTGQQGPKGDTGAKGDTGPKGDTGAAGQRGNTISTGVGIPSAAAQPGDLYIDTATWDLYQYGA